MPPWRSLFNWFSSPQSSIEAPFRLTSRRFSRDTIDRFLSDLTVSPIRNSRLVDVRFDSPNPATAARVANALARAYIDQNLEFKFLSSTKEASDWLGAATGRTA